MKKRTTVLATEEDLLVDLTFHNFPASLLTEFAEKIVRPYYKGNMNAAVQDLIQKTIAEQDFILSHITHVRTVETQPWARPSRHIGWLWNSKFKDGKASEKP